MKLTRLKAALPSGASARVVTLIVLHWCIVIAMAFALSARAATELSLSNKPLFVQNSAPSNVFFMVDDSGSMDWSVMSSAHWHFTNYTQITGAAGKLEEGHQVIFTDAAGNSCKGAGLTPAGPVGSAMRYLYNNSDNVYSGCGNANVEQNRGVIARDWRVLSSAVNVLYYDPTQTYEPWPGYDDASFTSARSHPNSALPGYNLKRDLSSAGGFVYMIAQDSAGFSGSRPAAGNYTVGGNGQVDLWDNYLQVKVTNVAIEIEKISYVGPSTACSVSAHLESPAYKSCFGGIKETVPYDPALFGGRTLAQEQTNIANWYQYHRRRSFVPRAAIAEVIRSVPNFRYGISMINNYGDLFVPFPAMADNFAIHNESLLQNLYAYPQRSYGTPLRSALENVGKYYEGKRKDYDNPYLSECQQSFSLLLSDGYWNSGEPGKAIGDSDGDGKALTLADVAHYYYNRDLSPLPNKVPVDPSCDAASSKAVCDLKSTQHMVTFTLAFGVAGKKLDVDGDGWPDPFLRESDNWGAPGAGQPEKIDDLWHAAYNSRGRFISARTPADVRKGLISAINSIASRNNSGSAVAVNRSTLSSESLVFRTAFTSADWSGEVTAQNVDPATGLLLGEAWSASEILNKETKPDDRVVLTYQPKSDRGIAFRWPENFAAPTEAELGPEQVALLLKAREKQDKNDYGKALVRFLRGDRSSERLSAGADPKAIAFRLRGQVLGDIIDSEPVYVGQPTRRYRGPWEEGAPENSHPYSTYKATVRKPMIYVGANDGMLHGFSTNGPDAGRELLAYIPNGVFDRVSDLSQPTYIHDYFVNGSPIAEDVYFSRQADEADNGWRTILVGGLDAGGQSIYALDVTDPTRFSEANAEKIVLWEFSDPDLGLTFGRPAVGRLANGRWAVVFGSGINNTRADGSASASGNAFLFIVDAETGELIKKFDTERGFADDPLGLERPNAMWSPVLVDRDGGGIVESIYAGDLFGNLWKWDVNGSTVSSWNFAFSGTKPQPLFVAKNASGEPQPITSRPEVGFHPTEEDTALVFFGTGKYIEVNDNLTDRSVTQSFYAVSDNTSGSLNRSNLQRQEIVAEYTSSGEFDLRKTSNEPVDWTKQKGWYLDLKSPSGDPRGERVINDPVLRGGKVIFTTVLPSADSCSAGGSGWLMELDAATGSRPQVPVVDINNDGVVDSLDKLPGRSAKDIFPSGLRNRTGGMPERPAIVIESQLREKKYINQSSGGVLVITEDAGLPRAGRQSWRHVR